MSQMLKNYKLTILIPCYNEEKGIGKVIDAIPHAFLSHLGYVTDVIVIDNNSTDKTAQVAKSKNVQVISETKKGKGNALITGFNALSDDTSFVVMLDGDNTYKAKEIPRLLEPLRSNFCDVVIGSRLGGKVKTNSLKLANRIANWGYTFLVRQFYGANTTDLLSGFVAWKKKVVDQLHPHLESEGFTIEMEMVTKMSKLGFEMYSVPITYDSREGYSKVDVFTDGIKVLHMLVKNLTWKPRNKPTEKLPLNSLSQSY